jgi:hypothetical protein
VFNWHNFLSGCSTWDLADWQKWIDQSARMRFNTIMVHAYGNNPMFAFTHNGLEKPTGYLSTTARGRDWGTEHVLDVRRMIGAAGLFDSPVFGASAALASEGQTHQAATALMQKVFQFASDPVQEAIRPVSRHRPVIPIVWAQHDDRSFATLEVRAEPDGTTPTSGQHRGLTTLENCA